MILGVRGDGGRAWLPHRWYAWHPVRLRDGRWAWLEVVLRREMNNGLDMTFWVYDQL